MFLSSFSLTIWTPARFNSQLPHCDPTIIFWCFPSETIVELHVLLFPFLQVGIYEGKVFVLGANDMTFQAKEEVKAAEAQAGCSLVVVERKDDVKTIEKTYVVGPQTAVNKAEFHQKFQSFFPTFSGLYTF